MDSGYTITLDADQVDLIQYALKDYVTVRGPRAAAKLRLDYGMELADMDVETLVAACADAVYDMCRDPLTNTILATADTPSCEVIPFRSDHRTL